MAKNVFRGDMLSSIPAPKLKKNWFDLSHENKLTAGMGTFIPIDWFDGVPGDVHKIRPSMLLRWQALIAPIMHRVDVSIHYFKVPKRLLFKDFETFYTGGVSGNEATAGIPYWTYDDILSALDANAQSSDKEQYLGSLLDYLGVPLEFEESGDVVAIDNAETYKFDVMPVLAYMKIWLDWYRDISLDETDVQDQFDWMSAGGHAIGDGGVVSRFGLSLLRRCWRKDYFTSCLPQSQRGQQVEFSNLVEVNTSSPSFQVTGPLSGINPVNAVKQNIGGKTTLYAGSDPTNELKLSPDAITTNPISVTLLRYGLKLQQYLERNNYAGGRYQEQLLARFGVQPRDSRLQRSEYIGGGSQPVVISEVESNATTEQEVTGQLAGKAKVLGSFGEISTFCEEECIIMGIMSIMPRANYFQGLDRKWQRFDRLDYFVPEFQNIGDMAVKTRELYFNAPENKDFGYQQRYLDYKFRNDEVHGDMRDSLLFWHLARKFDLEPILNSEFVECNPDESRIFATGADLGSKRRSVIDLWFNHKALRPMSLYSVPKLT